MYACFASARAQETGASFTVPFFRQSVGTGDRRKLHCTLLLPKCGYERQVQASLYSSSTKVWARETGASFTVPFFCHMCVVDGYKKPLLLQIPSLWKVEGIITKRFLKCRTPTADGMSFRGCLSGGGDIFSKSVEHQGGANRTFATGGRCHGWQLEPCPCGLEPLLTFRQKIPTGRPTPRKDVSFAMGVRGSYDNPTLRAMHPIHKCVAKNAPHLFH